MGNHIQKDMRIRILAVSAFMVLVTLTIYVSAASRRGAYPAPEPIDLTDSQQVAEALSFDPLEPERAANSSTGLEKTTEVLDIATEGSDHVEYIALETAQYIAQASPAGAESPQETVELAAAVQGWSEWTSPEAPNLPAKPQPDKKSSRGIDFSALRTRRVGLIGGAVVGVVTAIAVPIAVSNSGDSSSSRSPASP